MWGVFKNDKELHVIPCNKEGEITKPHTVDIFCFCDPQYRVRKDGQIIVIHNIEN